MKTYIIASPLEEAKERLAKYYDLRATQELGLASTVPGRKRKSHFEIRAEQFARLAQELREMEVVRRSDLADKIGFVI